jgi:hypothetical protein
LDGVNKTPYNKEKSTYRRKEEHWESQKRDRTA